MKKILSLILVVCMVLALSACQFSADNKVKDGVYKSRTMKLMMDIPDGWDCTPIEKMGERNTIMFKPADDTSEKPAKYIYAYMDTCYDFQADYSYIVAESMQALNAGKNAEAYEFEILQSNRETVLDKEGFVYKAKCYDKAQNITFYISQYFIFDEGENTMYMLEFYEQGEGSEYAQQMEETFMNTLNSFKPL